MLQTIKLLAAGLAICARAHTDCSHISQDDFLAIAARLGMAQSSEIEGAARIGPKGMCDIYLDHGVYHSGHNANGAPTAVYVYSHCLGSPCVRSRPVTGFLCLK